MNIEKYKKLREEIRNQSFEKKYTTVDWILYYASFFGNIASIFFAFFLWFPSLLKTITLHVADNALTYGVAVGVTIILLSVVEFLKRGILGIFSSEFIEANAKFSNKSVVALFFFSIAILGLSFYFSINGAMEFSKTSGKINVGIEANTKILVDSLTKINEKDKQPIIEELASLRASNKDLRLKRDDTPLNERRVRKEYNDLIDENEKLIERNSIKLSETDLSLKKKLDGIKAEDAINKSKNEQSDKGNIMLFLIVSTFIEIMIVIGVYFRELYIHKAFYESELKLEPIVRKREKYETLLRLVYKNGEVRQDDTILSLKKLTEIVKNKGVQFTPKHISDFYLELTHLGAFKVVSNKRYAMVSYNEAKKLLDSLENI
jgi:hypothetical protein